MKKIVFTLLALCFLLLSKAQSTTDTSMRATAVAVCDCLGKANITDKSTTEQMQQAFLNCIITSAPDFIAKIGSNGNDLNAAQEIATQLGMEMIKINCPAFMKIANAMMNDDSNGLQLTMPSTVETEKVESTDGVVINVEEKDFVYIKVKTTAGRELNFIYYNYVPGSDDWIKDPVTKLKNKNVSLSYTENEVYQPKFKQFMNVKQIKTLTIK